MTLCPLHETGEGDKLGGRHHGLLEPLSRALPAPACPPCPTPAHRYQARPLS